MRSRGRHWTTHAVVDGEPVDTLSARDIFRRMADAAWICGDPGIQYDTTINDWHTSARTRIGSTRSNPCSEYMFLNDTACNLASLNLMKFVHENGEFQVEDYRYAARADDHRAGDPRRQRVVPDAADRGERHKFRPLGLGLRQPRRPAHDTRPRVRLAGRRKFAAALTAIMHGEAYRQSSVIARDHGGPFLEYDVNASRSCGSSASTATRPTGSRRAGVPGPPRGGPAVFDEALELGRRTATATPR